MNKTNTRTKTDRRRFFRNAFAGSAGMFFIPSILKAASLIDPLMYSPSLNGISESGVFRTDNKNAVQDCLLNGLATISVIEDACILAFCSGRLSDRSCIAATADIHVRVPGSKGRLAGVLPPEDKRIFELIDILKNNPGADHFDEKLALVFGWTGVNAAYRKFSPFLEGKDPGEALIIRINQDALLIREFSKPESDPTRAAVKDVENMLHAMLARALTRVHTLKPDTDDGMGWVNRMAAWRRRNREIMEMYARAIVQSGEPDAGKNFYDRADGIIAAARKLQKSWKVEPETIFREAGKAGGSFYARAIRENFNSIISVNDYLEDRCSRGELSSTLLG